MHLSAQPVCSVAVAAVVAVCCTLATPVGAAGPSDEVAELLDKAAKKEYAGRHKKAMRLYRKADEAAGGRSREALVGLARIAYRIGDHERAREAADRLLEHPPWPGEESPGWTIYPVAEVDAPPRSLRAAIRNEGVEAEPEKMVEVPDAEKTGETILESIVDAEGCTLAVRVVATDLQERIVDGQVESALNAVFEPAILDGEPVAVYVQKTSPAYTSFTLELVGRPDF